MQDRDQAYTAAMNLTPNRAMQRTLTGGLRPPVPAAYGDRWAARWLSVLNFSVDTMHRISRSTWTDLQRLMQLAAAGALAMRPSSPPDIPPAFLRFNGMRCPSQGFRRCEPTESGVAFARVSVSGFWRLPPNKRVNRTAH